MSKMYNIAAIPTPYAGVNFRSRLEARWAAFFDLAGWKWDYEPLDLDGWIPDFRLRPTLGIRQARNGDRLYGGTVDLYVEIKPAGEIFDTAYEPHPEYRKATAHCDDVWVLLLGMAPMNPESTKNALGLLCNQPPNSDDSWMHVDDILSGRDPANPEIWADITALWREAGNLTQWRRPRMRARR